MEPVNSVKYVIACFLLVILGGMTGYILIEEAPPLDALYMTVITIATVGYREVFDLSDSGRIFTMLLILAGGGVILVGFGVLAQLAIEGSLRRVLGRRRVEKIIEKLQNHYILCGCGRIGKIVAHELREMNRPLVIIEQNAETAALLNEEGYYVVHGNATEEEILEKTRISQARGLVVNVSTDAESVFIILSARNLNPDLFIIARAVEEQNERKLKQAGANRVLSSYRLMGKRMVNAILRPAVIDMLDTLMFESHLDLVIEGAEVYSISPLVGMTLRDSGIRQKLGLIVIGVQKANGNLLFNPSPEEVIEPGDTLISIGQKDSIRKLAEWLSGRN